MEVLTLSCIKNIVKRHPLSELQAQQLSLKEQSGLGRKGVMECFAALARKAALKAEREAQQQAIRAQKEVLKAARLVARREAAEREVARKVAFAAQAQAQQETLVAKRKQALLDLKASFKAKVEAEREARVQHEREVSRLNTEAKLEAVERRAAKRRDADRKLQEERERKWKLQDAAESIALRVSIYISRFCMGALCSLASMQRVLHLSLCVCVSVRACLRA